MTTIPVTVPLNAAVTMAVAVPPMITAPRTTCGVVHLMVALTLTITACFRGHGNRITAIGGTLFLSVVSAPRTIHRLVKIVSVQAALNAPHLLALAVLMGMFLKVVNAYHVPIIQF